MATPSVTAAPSDQLDSGQLAVAEVPLVLVIHWAEQLVVGSGDSQEG